MTSEKHTQQDNEPVEVVDGLGRTLAVVPAGDAHRQSLPHRAVLVLFFNREGKLLLGKRPKGSHPYPGRWDLTARDHVRPGEASLDAAKRLADSRFKGQGGLPALHLKLPPSEGTGFEAVTVYRYCVAEEFRQPRDREVLAVSQEELAAMAVDFRELFTPAVIQTLEGRFFSKNDG